MIATSHREIDNRDSRLQSNADVVKVVVIGEPQVGKTSFIRRYWEHHEPEEIYHYNGATVYPCEFREHGINRRATIYEIPGDPAFGEDHRTSHYWGAHVIVWMYAIDDPVSLEILRDEWLPGAEEVINLGSISSVLLGNKRDLRHNRQVIERLAEEGRAPVTTEQAGELLLRETIMHFSEISANAPAEVDEAFDVILYLALHLA